MIRQRVLAAARAAGMEPALRSTQRALLGRAQRRNLRDDEHLAAILAAILRHDSNCVDAGANVGDVLAHIARLAPTGSHLAVEPLPELAAALEERHPGVEVECCALADRDGEETFYRHTDAPSRSSLRRGDEEERSMVALRTSVRRLDDLVPRDRDVAFVKIDVEGAEEGVLRGAMETLSRCRPLVAIEHGAAAVRSFGTSHRTIHELLEATGLALFDMDGRGPLSADEFDEIADPPGDRWNFFARPL